MKHAVIVLALAVGVISWVVALYAIVNEVMAVGVTADDVLTVAWAAGLMVVFLLVMVMAGVVYFVSQGKAASAEDESVHAESVTV